MNRRAMSVLVVALAVSILSVPVLAHHGTAAYDTTKTVTVKGHVTQFNFINPHCQVFFDVADEKGAAEKWQAELTSPNHLIRTGWTKTSLKPGDEVTITGYRAKDGSNSIWIGKIMLGDTELKLSGDQ